MSKKESLLLEYSRPDRIRFLALFLLFFSVSGKANAQSGGLTEELIGTKWHWQGRSDFVLEFGENGAFNLPAWDEQGITAVWEATGNRQVTVTVTSQKFNNSTATLNFDEDLTSFTGTDLGGQRAINRSPRYDPSRESPATTSSRRTILVDSSFQVNGEEGRKLNRSIGTIHALLVRPLEDGQNAASAMKLTVTAIAERTDGRAEVSFNQEVGEDMKRANQEVARAVMLRNGGFPANTNVRFGFADKWGGKDGPSAAVACAILLESLFHGFEIPTTLAVTGDLNADSTVQPVGGVADKIRGAMGAGCHLIGIPAANEEDITDLVVEESLRRFLTAKVFTLTQLDEALALADSSRMTEAGRAALADLDAVQKELTAQGAAIYTPEMQQRLASIQSALPNCYTAKILAAAGRRALPARYSLVGTLMRIDDAMIPYSTAMAKIKEGSPIEEYRIGRNNPIQETKNRLNNLRSRSDERLVAVIDTQKSLIDQFQRLLNADVGSRSVLDNHIREIEKAEERAGEAWRKIKENREIQDQFMKRGISL